MGKPKKLQTSTTLNGDVLPTAILGKPKKLQMSTTRRSSWELQKGVKLIEPVLLYGSGLTAKQIDEVDHATKGQIAAIYHGANLARIDLSDISQANDFDTTEVGREIADCLAANPNAVLVSMVAKSDDGINSSRQALCSAIANGTLRSICFEPPTQKDGAVEIKANGKLVLNGWTVAGTMQKVDLVIHPNDCFDKSRHVGDHGHPTSSATMHVVKVHA